MVNIRVTGSKKREVRPKVSALNYVSNKDSEEIKMLREYFSAHRDKIDKRLNLVLDSIGLSEEDMANAYAMLDNAKAMDHRARKLITELRFLIGVSESMIDRLGIKEPE